MKSAAIFFFTIVISFSTLYAQSGIELKREIEKAMVYEVDIDTAKMTGWVIGCIDNDSSWIFGYGRMAKDRPLQPDASTIFEIGGVTKAFTASVLQLMIHQGVLRPDTIINAYLTPEQHFLVGNHITLLQLMTHTSGLPKLPDGFGTGEKDKDQPYADYTEGRLFDYLKSIDTTDIKTGKYLYSHLNHAILEKIITNYGGEKALKQFEEKLDKDPQYYIQGYNPAQIPVPNWQFRETFEYSLGMKANMKMMLDFIKINLAIKDTSYSAILRGGQNPIFKTDIDKKTSIGRAWHVYQYKKRPVVCLQTGSTNGQSTFVAFVPETKTGVVIMANSRLVQSKLGMLILKILNYNWRRE